jgi:V-type H+-transporting ATPase subunit D
MAAVRLAVFPTRQNLQVMKIKHTGAKKGHSLLKKKADALSMRLRALLQNILTVRGPRALAPPRARRAVRSTDRRRPLARPACAQAKEEMGVAFKEGNFALAEVKYAAGDIKPMVIEGVGTAQKRVEIRVDNIAGVKVPVFKSIDTGAVSQDHTGARKERAARRAAHGASPRRCRPIRASPCAATTSCPARSGSSSLPLKTITRAHTHAYASRAAPSS